MSSRNSVASFVRKESQNGRVVTCPFRCCRKAIEMKFEGFKTACNKEVNIKNSHLTRGTWIGERMGAANNSVSQMCRRKSLSLSRCHANIAFSAVAKFTDHTHDDDKRVAGAVRFEIYSANTFCSFRCHTRLNRMRQNNGRDVLPMSAVGGLHTNIYYLLFGIPWRRTAYELCVVPAIIFAFLLNLFMCGSAGASITSHVLLHNRLRLRRQNELEHWKIGMHERQLAFALHDDQWKMWVVWTERSSVLENTCSASKAKIVYLFVHKRHLLTKSVEKFGQKRM